MRGKVFYWRARFVAGGPWVGVKTLFGPPIIDGEELDRSPRWQAFVRNERTGRAVLFGDNCPIEVEGKDIMLRNIEGITQQEYEYLVAHSAWATQHAPHMPDAAPKTRIDKRGKSVW